MMGKRGIGLLLILALVGILAGCGADAPKEGGQAGGSIVAYVGANIFDSSLDPVKGAMSYGYSFTNAALLKVSPTSDYAGDMATDWLVSDDALTYTFTLREGVVFSDGSPMTAEDVVFTYETVKANQAQNENVDLTRLKSAAAQGAHTVVFTLTEPFSPFLDTAAMLGIVPKAGYDSALFDHAPIGTGPWRVIQYDANQQIILAPNERYYEGAPSIERVTLVYMDGDAALSAARSGQLDVVMVSPNYAHETVAGMTMAPLETMDIRNVSLPMEPGQNEVTADFAVRRALAIGIDRERIIQNAYNGVGRPAVGFTDNLIWAAGTAYADNRAEEAISLLEEAGWVDADGDGIREKDGVLCAFDLYAVEDRYALAAALAEDAARLGIKITPRASDWGEITNNMYNSGVLWGWGQYSPTVLASLFHSKYAYSGGFDNVVAYKNPEVDALIERALSQTSQAAAVADWKAVQERGDADFPYLYIVNVEHCYFVSDRLDISLETQIPHPHGHGSPIICNMKDWTLK